MIFQLFVSLHELLPFFEINFVKSPLFYVYCAWFSIMHGWAVHDWVYIAKIMHGLWQKKIPWKHFFMSTVHDWVYIAKIMHGLWQIKKFRENTTFDKSTIVGPIYHYACHTFATMHERYNHYPKFPIKQYRFFPQNLNFRVRIFQLSRPLDNFITKILWR